MDMTLEYEGKTYRNFQSEELIKAGVPKAVVDREIAAMQAVAVRDQMRNIIAKNVGDTSSLVGTVSDAAGLLIAIALADVVALSSNTSFADYRKAKLETLKLLAGDKDIAALAAGALQQLQSGEAVLTASLKGLDVVINESLTRSTAVATILAQASEQQGS